MLTFTKVIQYSKFLPYSTFLEALIYIVWLDDRIELMLLGVTLKLDFEKQFESTKETHDFSLHLFVQLE